ncbi:MAG: hypothetical protein H0W09_07135, partial [Solirubrobacterales bacterium]|nr:hypothetical protein [Solirubrobacterales bacterium]
FQVVPLDRLDELRLFADVSRATPVVLLIVTLILDALALLIAAGCRRTVGFRIGISLLVVAGLGFLARLVGGLVVDSLISPGDQAEPGVDAVWSAATSLLVWLSSLTALAGLFIAIATWFAGRLGAERRQHSETAETA